MAYCSATPALGLERLLVMFSAIAFDAKMNSIADNGVDALLAAMLGCATCWFDRDVERRAGLGRERVAFLGCE